MMRDQLDRPVLKRLVRSLKATLLRDFRIKAFCFLLAFSFWWWLEQEERSIGEFQVPLVFKNLPPQTVLTGDYPDTVAVRIQAPNATLSRTTPQDIDVGVDLSSLASGEHNYNLTPELIRVPFGLEVLQVSPSLIHVYLENLLSKEVPVKPIVEGDPASHYEVVGFQVRPPAVILAGAASELEAIEFLETERIVLNGQRESFILSVAPLLPTSTLRIKGEGRVEVEVQISETLIRRTFSDVPITLRNTRYRTQFNPSSIQVTLVGPASILRTIQPDNILALLDVASLAPRAEDYHMAPEIRLRPPSLREKINVDSFSQNQIDVKVYNQPLREEGG